MSVAIMRMKCNAVSLCARRAFIWSLMILAGRRNLPENRRRWRERSGDVLLAIHHIGSTAIPGICAKPIIGILAVVRDVTLLDGSVEKMESLGYEAMGEFGIRGRRYFRKDNDAGDRTHQIHAFGDGSPQIERQLAFRDFMNHHRDYAERYDALKRRLAGLHPADVSGYTDGNDEFIAEMEARAAAWRSARSV